MSDSNQSLEEILFDLALQKSSAAERAAFLDHACRDNLTLRASVEELLEGYFGGVGFLPKAKLPERTEASPLELPREPEVPRMIGRYKLLQKLGEGGFGEVWMAEQKEPVKRRVALKIIKLGMDSKQVVARFEAERQALAMMDHPNIAKVFDAGTTDTGRPYFVMELVRGIRITDYCDKQKLTTRERLELFVKVCHAVQHAHQKGIIHRDLKPSNVLVTLHDGVPVPKVIDFGIAKATQKELTDKTVFTLFEQFIGTPAYVSPEQAEMSGLDIDTRSDLYSLGVLLYELLVGRTPFDAAEMTRGGLDALRKIIREKEPARPSTRLRTLTSADLSTTAERQRSDGQHLANLLRGDLDWIVMKCLEKDRVRRYDTANGLASDIQRYLTNEPVAARPPSAAYKIQKAWQRNKLVWTSAAVVAVAILVGFGVSTWQAVRATRAQRAENAQKLIAETKQREAETAQSVAEQERQKTQAEKEYSERLFYDANMNLVQAAFEANNYVAAQRLLTDTASYPDKGFEWYYWQREMHRAVREFRGHTEGILGIAFSRDASRMASVDKTGLLKIWDRATGSVIVNTRVYNDDSNSPVELAFSPDGNRVLSKRAWNNGSLVVMDARTGAQLLTNLKEFNIGNFSADGERMVAHNDKKIAIADAASGALLTPILDLNEPGQRIGFARFSRDGHQLAAIVRGRDGPVYVRRWDAVTWERIGTDIHFGAALQSPEVVDFFRSASWAISPDLRWLFAGTFFGKNLLIDLATGEPVKPIGELRHFLGHEGQVVQSFSPDSKYLLTGSEDKTARVWDTATLKEVRRLPGHTEWISAVAWSPDGRWLATGEFDSGTVRIWEAGNTPSQTIWTNIDQRMIVSPDGNRILTTQSPAMTLWDPVAKQPIQTFDWAAAGIEGEASVNAGDISPDGRLIVTISEDEKKLQQATVWDIKSGSPLFSPKLPPNNGISSARFSSDSRLMVVASRAQSGASGKAIIWSAETGQLIRQFDHRTASVEDAVFTLDGQQLVTASFESSYIPSYDPQDAGIRVWDVANGREVMHFAANIYQFDRIALSPNGKRFAVGVSESLVKVFDLESGRELATLAGHRESIRALVYSPDGRRILTGSADSTARLWDAESGREMLTLRGHMNNVVEAGFPSQGRQIVTRSWDKTARFWDIATPEEVSAWEKDVRSHAERIQERLSEEKEQRIADLKEKERLVASHANDPGAIKNWLLLLPIRIGTANVATLDQQQLPSEPALRPVAGQIVDLGGGTKLTWQPARQKSYKLDFNAILGYGEYDSIAYAVAYVKSEVARTNLQIKIGSDDLSKLYLNGEEIHRTDIARVWQPDQDTATGVSLKAGINTLLFKVLTDNRDWIGSVRIADADGNSVPGLSVTLDPEGRE